MMTQAELREYYRDRAALRITEETLAGLREYAAASDDDLERDIAALEETAKEQAAALRDEAERDIVPLPHFITKANRLPDYS